MESIRKPTKDEMGLLKLLVKNASIKIPNNWNKNLLVQNMNDGQMGSLYLFPNGEVTLNRTFNKCISQYSFKDQDDVEVIVSLNIDEKEQLMELDVWKVNFDKLLSFPVL
jgi:hypothetical protein